MEKLSPDILIAAYGLLLDEVSQGGSKDELEAVTKYTQRVIMRQLAPKIVEKEEKARERIEERMRGENKRQRSEALVNVVNNPTTYASGAVHEDKSRHMSIMKEGKLVDSYTEGKDRIYEQLPLRERSGAS